MIWRDPQAFLLLVLLIVLFFLKLRWKVIKTPAVRGNLSAEFLQQSPGARVWLSRLADLLRWVSFALVVVALARPQSASDKIKKNVEGIDMVVALDISDSMLIEDMKPENRMESAKAMIKQFIEARVSDRIGLVIFSGEAFTRVPPTLDYKLLLENLSQVEAQRDLKLGTAIGVALATSVARLRESTAKSRVIVLLTDGENNSGTIAPEAALEIAKGYGIKVYTIGIGKDGDSQLPVFQQDLFGRTVKRYQPIHSTVNDQLLDQIATETGGKYYRATSGSALEKVFREIDRLEKSKVEVNQFTRFEELFQRYLFWALVLFVSALCIQYFLVRRSP